VDTTASSNNIPEPKYLIYYLGEISLNQEGRSSEVFYHPNKEKTPSHLREMAEND